jgi:hypothetical protein
MHLVFFPHKQDHLQNHTLTATVGVDGALVFDEEDICAANRSVDDTLAVDVAHKAQVFHYLTQAFDGISDTCGECPDERLFCALQILADLGHWQSLDEIETWLLERNIPFVKRRWSKVE